MAAPAMNDHYQRMLYHYRVKVGKQQPTEVEQKRRAAALVNPSRNWRHSIVYGKGAR
jgi:hypothetical protein